MHRCTTAQRVAPRWRAVIASTAEIRTPEDHSTRESEARSGEVKLSRTSRQKRIGMKNFRCFSGFSLATTASAASSGTFFFSFSRKSSFLLFHTLCFEHLNLSSSLLALSNWTRIGSGPYRRWERNFGRRRKRKTAKGTNGTEVDDDLRRKKKSSPASLLLHRRSFCLANGRFCCVAFVCLCLGARTCESVLAVRCAWIQNSGKRS